MADRQTGLGWKDKPADDPSVTALRAYLEANNCIKGLEILDPTDVEYAVTLFRRDGFVVVGNVLSDEQVHMLAAGCIAPSGRCCWTYRP